MKTILQIIAKIGIWTSGGIIVWFPGKKNLKRLKTLEQTFVVFLLGMYRSSPRVTTKEVCGEIYGKISRKIL